MRHRLLGLGAAALDQDNKNNHKQHTRNNLDNRRTTHSNSLSCNSIRNSLPGLSGTWPMPGASAARSSVHKHCLPAGAFNSTVQMMRPRPPDYLVLVRRRWIRTIRITTNSTPATTWIIAVLLIATPFLATAYVIAPRPERNMADAGRQCGEISSPHIRVLASSADNGTTPP